MTFAVPSVVCYECGTWLESTAALNSHVGSRPCKLAKTKREMDRRGWVMCTAPDAERVLVLCDIEYEKAPGENRRSVLAQLVLSR